MVETVVIRTAYNEAALLDALRGWWDDECGGANDPFAAPPTEKRTVMDLSPPLDSLRVVKGLLVIEEIIGRKVPVRFIKKGGYSTFDEFASDMVPKIREFMFGKQPEVTTPVRNGR